MNDDPAIVSATNRAPAADGVQELMHDATAPLVDGEVTVRAHLGEIEIMIHAPFILAVSDFFIQPLSQSSGWVGDWDNEWGIDALLPLARTRVDVIFKQARDSFIALIV